MNLSPRGYRVLVKRKIIGKSSGGLYLPANSKEAKINIGEVVAIGTDCEVTQIGDIVTFGKYAFMVIDPSELELYGIKYKPDGECEYLIINEEDILCDVITE